MKKIFIIIQFAIKHWPEIWAAAERVARESLVISELAKKLAEELAGEE